MIAPFTTATLPLQSCRMHDLRFRSFLGCFHAIDGDRSRFRTAIEADATAGASFTDVARRMHAVGVQAVFQLQHLRRTGLDAETAAFAFLLIHDNTTAGLSH